MDRPPPVSNFSYATPEDPPLRRWVIRAIEAMAGKRELKRLYDELHETWGPDENFFDACVRVLRLDVAYEPAKLDALPADGPVVVVSNHPYGVLDGIVACWLTAKIRPKFKILINAVLERVPEITPFTLPIDFRQTEGALATNLRTRAEARRLLAEGGALLIFPGGTVSTVIRPLERHAYDPLWKTFTARLIQQAKAPVLPVYFPGQNGRAFQVSSHFSQTLRLSLLFKELRGRVGSRVAVHFGDVIPWAELEPLGHRRAIMDHLRARTYALGGLANPPALTLYDDKDD